MTMWQILGAVMVFGFFGALLIGMIIDIGWRAAAGMVGASLFLASFFALAAWLLAGGPGL